MKKPLIPEDERHSSAVPPQFAGTWKIKFFQRSYLPGNHRTLL